MELTTAILVSNGFTLSGDIYSKTVSDKTAQVDSHFQIIYLNNAYPEITTVAEANARFVALGIGITLV